MTSDALSAAQSRDRARLLAAFIALVGARSYEEVEPDAVARQVGLEPSAFHAHFVDRRACFFAAWDRLESVYWRQLMASQRGCADLHGRLAAGLMTTFDLIEAQPTAARFMTIGTHSAPVPERLRQRPLAIRLEVLLRDALGDVRDEGCRNPAGWLLATIYDRIYRHLSAGTENRLSGEVSEVLALAGRACPGMEQRMSDPDLRH